MKRFVFFIAVILLCKTSQAWHQIFVPNIKTLQVVVNRQWTGIPVMQLSTSDVLHVGFDELSHNYHRFVCRLERCEPDWSGTDGLFESDWLEGFNDLPIDNYENSLNTTVDYTHYTYTLPNDQQRLKMSGNYRLHILDEDNGMNEVLVAEFRVVEPIMNVALAVTTNTDLDHQQRYQQVSMSVGYNGLRVTNPKEQLQTIVMQNGREANMRLNVMPTYTTRDALRWEHSRELIFEGGNEYHKFEVLDVSHPTMGIDHISWDEAEGRYHAFPFLCEPRRNYLYDEDADGAFYIRNSDNIENDRISDYVFVHYRLAPAPPYDGATLYVDGLWTTEPRENYVMHYDAATKTYEAVVLQKQGYYNYQLLMDDCKGRTHLVPEEGSFYQTENRYQAFVYYQEPGARTWRLTGFAETQFKTSR